MDESRETKRPSAQTLPNRRGIPDWFLSKPVLWATGAGVLGALTILLVIPSSLLRDLFSSDSLLPHRFCYQLRPGLVWTHVIADSFIGMSYLAISVTLAYLVVRGRKDVPFRWMFLAFGLFIVACGGTHFMEVVTTWLPVYWLSAALKIVTAAVSALTAIVLPFSVGEILGLVRQAKTARSTETRFRLLVEGATEFAIFALDENGIVVSWNPGAQRINGYRAEEIIGQHFSCFYPEKDKKNGEPARELEQVRATGRFEEEGWRIRKDGSQFWANVLITAMRDSRGNQIGFSKLTRDLTERQRSQQKLQQSEEKFHKAFESAPLAVTISTLAEGRYLEVNEAFLRMVGRDRNQVVGRTSVETGLWTRPDDRLTMIGEVTKKGHVAGFETAFDSVVSGARQVRIFAETIELDDTLCLVAVTEDLTESRLLENQYRQAQKMEAIGRLAGGIAHDFNNVLNVILGYCELLLESKSVSDSARIQVEHIDNAGRRAAELTQQLLAFGRQQVMQGRVLNLNSVLEEMSDMLGRLIGEDIEIITSFDKSLGLVKTDPAQIVQIVINLVVNARDAMPDGGSLRIETANVRINGKPVHADAAIAPGDYVQLVITDTGLGMNEETKAHIFEPFFTTKETGTGLGLSTVYGIVKQSGGFIWVYSEPNHGTAFKLYFPRTSALEVESDIPLPGSSLDAGGTETILLVEDNDELRELSVAFLKRTGYLVLEANNSAAALEIALNHKGVIDLLVTDVVLPKMSGRVLATKFMALWPLAKVLFISGYTDDVVMRHGVLNEGLAFLQKPYSREDLTCKVRAVLDSRSSQEESS